MAIAGVGGLGHLALQFAAKMSKVSKVIAVSRSDSKKDEAIKFGASECVSHWPSFPPCSPCQVWCQRVRLALAVLPTLLTLSFLSHGPCGLLLAHELAGGSAPGSWSARIRRR